ncbi:MAG: regulatory protein RecX [Patescibacteria group bacterium]|nr:regulatory protein RecX [Patescibacteria group bacterium]
MLSALNKALQLLNYSDNTAFDLRKKLLAKGYSESEISEAVSKLIKNGVLSDDRWLENKLLEMQNLRPRSLKKIIFELRAHGFSAEQIETKWNQLGLSDDKLAWKVICQRERSISDRSQKSMDKLMRYLANRGFRLDTIKNAINKLMADKTI